MVFAFQLSGCQKLPFRLTHMHDRIGNIFLYLTDDMIQGFNFITGLHGLAVTPRIAFQPFLRIRLVKGQ